MLRVLGSILAVVVFLASGASAAPPDRADADQLARILHDLLPTLLPNPLYEDTRKWGLQREIRKHLRNDGRWSRVKVSASQLDRWLSVDVFDLKRGKNDTMTFGLTISLEAAIDYDRQTWLSGLRLYAGSVRARARAVVSLRCETASRLETPKGSLIPEMVLTFRILDGAFKYDNVVVEHLPGFGGDAAEILGEAFLDVLMAVKPGLEKRLLDKAHEAILKAGKTREVRLGLGKWLGK